MQVRYLTKEAILERAQEIIGIPLKEIDKTGRLSVGKGAIGTMIEENWFGYKPNSFSKPDFLEAGVELKVIPFIKKKNEIHAKERLVCNIINYYEECNKNCFEESSFWKKCNTMLLMAYEHIKEIPKGDYKIEGVALFEFPQNDLEIIKHDWQTIVNKIKEGYAHEISEGDTDYLGACTKGVNSSSVRKQPFSPILAKQRAFSLKLSYINEILNTYVLKESKNKDICIIESNDSLKEISFEQYIIAKLEKYFGRTQKQLKKDFNININPKNINEILLEKMLGIKGKIAKTQEFKKASVIPKTIRIQKNNSIKESISMPSFNFISLSKEKKWEESELYNYLAPTKFMFVIFKECDDKEFKLNNVLFWNISEEDLNQVKSVWEKTITLIKTGECLSIKNDKKIKNFPKKSENYVAHVRPHAKNEKDELPLPDGRTMTKHCFWLNNTYIAEQIKNKSNRNY